MIDTNTVDKEISLKNQLLVALTIGLLGSIDIQLQSFPSISKHSIAIPNLVFGFMTGMILCFGSEYIIGMLIGTGALFAVTSLFLSFTQPLLIEIISSAIPLIALYFFRHRLAQFVLISSIKDLFKTIGLVLGPLSLIAPFIYLLLSAIGNDSSAQTFNQFFVHWLSQLNSCLLIIPLIIEWRFAQSLLLKSRSFVTSLSLGAIVLMMGQIVFFEWFSSPVIKLYWLIFSSVCFVIITRSVRMTLLLSLIISFQVIASGILKTGFFADDIVQTTFLNANIFIFGYIMTLLSTLYFLLDISILRGDIEANVEVLRLKCAALDAISQGVVITDANRKITYVNQGFRDLSLYNDSQLIGRDCNLLHGAETSAITINEILIGLEAKKPLRVEILNYKRNGEQFWNEVNISPVFTDGVITQFVDVQQDITWRKQAEKAALLATIVFEHNRNAIVITDSEKKIIAVNSMYTMITGYTAEEVIGNTPKMHSSGFHNDDFYKSMWDDLNKFGFWEGEIINKRKNGESYPQHLTISRVMDSQQCVTNYVGMFRDLSDEKNAINKISNLENNDHLTGLRNLPYLISSAKIILDNANIEKQNLQKNTAALILIDIDYFQNINDTLGHHIGDVVLIQIARILEDLSNSDGLLARQGGDEFIYFLPDISAKEVQKFARLILQRLITPFDAEGHKINLTASIGIARYPEDGEDIDALLKRADIALNHVKKNGKAKYQLHMPQLTQALNEKITIEHALESAAKNDEFVVFYQPVINIVSGKICSMEALIRWRHPQMGLISPVQFIPIAERSNTISTIGRWVLLRVCSNIRAALDAGFCVPPIAVNLSPKQFTDSNLVDDLLATLVIYQLSPVNLSIEITEGVLMNDPDTSKIILDKLRALGFSLALDDFGTGYSSLSYLKNFSFDKVKIDQSFVRELSAKNQDAAIINAIINMGHSLGIKVLAEGVETEKQCEFLRDQGIDEIQGYFFSQPLEWDKLLQLLKENRELAPHLIRHPPISKTLLLVDDEQNIVSALKRLLRRDGYEILTANSGADGLAILAKNKVDVIISDQRMPGMTGVEFLSAVKENYPNTIRMVLSGYTELKSVTDAINEGAVFRFLTKPWDDEKLRECVKEAFQYKNYSDENRKLSLEAQSNNFELAVAYRHLAETLEKKQHQIMVHTHSLDVVRETLRYIPVAVLGLDDQHMVAFINDSAIELFRDIPLNFGDELLLNFPELGEIIINSAESTKNAFVYNDQNLNVRWFNMGTSSTKGKIVTISH